MKMITVRSSNIAEIGYEDGNLFVRFHYADRLYRYRNVPEAIWKEFLAAESKGQFFKDRIKPYLRYEVVEQAA